MSLNKIFKAKDQLQAIAKINNPRLEKILDYLHGISVSSIESYKNSIGILRGFKFTLPNNDRIFYLSDDGKYFLLSVLAINSFKRKDYKIIKNIDELETILNGYRITESYRAKFVFE